MLECGDNLSVDVSGSVDIDPAHGSLGVDINTYLQELPIRRPYLINLDHVEYVEGTWNDDKSEYGIRIGYVSGTIRCFWGSTARSVLETLADWSNCNNSESICKKFDDRVKVGPPSA